ncbi:MAG: hypothetical protein HOI49_04255 [Bacteroidetes bacterium]|jgi:hypothetical protein|nr:hypothetical protein [Bacteroidota bacterium]
MSKKYSIREFADEIRRLYPGEYDDLQNEKLVSLWLKRYPSDEDKVDISIKEKTSYYGYVWLVIIVISLIFFFKNCSWGGEKTCEEIKEDCLEIFDDRAPFYVSKLKKVYNESSQEWNDRVLAELFLTYLRENDELSENLEYLRINCLNTYDDYQNEIEDKIFKIIMKEIILNKLYDYLGENNTENIDYQCDVVAPD